MAEHTHVKTNRRVARNDATTLHNSTQLHARIHFTRTSDRYSFAAILDIFDVNAGSIAFRTTVEMSFGGETERRSEGVLELVVFRREKKGAGSRRTVNYGWFKEARRRSSSVGDWQREPTCCVAALIGNFVAGRTECARTADPVCS